MWIAVAGKGGADKSLVAATLARLLARGGARVLALDCDLQPGLALGLGAAPPEEPSLDPAAGTRRERTLAAARGAGRGVGGAALCRRGARRRATSAGGQARRNRRASGDEHQQRPLRPRAPSARRVGPARLGRHRRPREAGPRQAAFDWAPYARRILLVVEPTWQSMLTARRIERVSAGRAGITSSLVVNRVRGEADARRVEDFLARRAIAVVPEDVSVAEAERHGRATLDEAPDCDAVRAIAALADSLRADSLAT